MRVVQIYILLTNVYSSTETDEAAHDQSIAIKSSPAFVYTFESKSDECEFSIELHKVKLVLLDTQIDSVKVSCGGLASFSCATRLSLLRLVVFDNFVTSSKVFHDAFNRTHKGNCLEINCENRLIKL